MEENNNSEAENRAVRAAQDAEDFIQAIREAYNVANGGMTLAEIDAELNARYNAEDEE